MAGPGQLSHPPEGTGQQRAKIRGGAAPAVRRGALAFQARVQPDTHKKSFSGMTANRWRLPRGTRPGCHSYRGNCALLAFSPKPPGAHRRAWGSPKNVSFTVQDGGEEQRPESPETLPLPPHRPKALVCTWWSGEKGTCHPWASVGTSTAEEGRREQQALDTCGGTGWAGLGAAERPTPSKDTDHRDGPMWPEETR